MLVRAADDRSVPLVEGRRLDSKGTQVDVPLAAVMDLVVRVGAPPPAVGVLDPGTRPTLP